MGARGHESTLGAGVRSDSCAGSRQAGLRKEILKAAVQFGENLSQARGSEQKLLFRRAPSWPK